MEGKNRSVPGNVAQSAGTEGDGEKLFLNRARYRDFILLPTSCTTATATGPFHSEPNLRMKPCIFAPAPASRSRCVILNH